MIATHDSLTFLAPRLWIMRPLSPLWCTQTKNLLQQAQAGCTYFDLRVRWHAPSRQWRACHGLVDLRSQWTLLADLIRETLAVEPKARLRIILERGNQEACQIFKIEINSIMMRFPQLPIAFIGIKKGWQVIHRDDPPILDRSFVPWLSGLTLRQNLKRILHQRLWKSSIRKWAKDHPVTKEMIADPNMLYFVDHL